MPDALKFILNLLRVVVLIVLGIFLLINFYGMYMQIVFNVDYPTILGLGKYIAEEDCSEAGISKYDYLITMDYLGYDKEDTVLYSNNGKSISAGRIANIKGDNVYLISDVENPLDISLMRGKVVFNIKGIGELISKLESTISIIIIIMICVVVYEIPKLIESMYSKKSVHVKRF